MKILKGQGKPPSAFITIQTYKWQSIKT